MILLLDRGFFLFSPSVGFWSVGVPRLAPERSGLLGSQLVGLIIKATPQDPEKRELICNYWKGQGDVEFQCNPTQ